MTAGGASAKGTGGAERARTAQGRSSRQRILDAAIGVFRRKGYAATTVDDLCAAAGLTKGSFFHHFSSKEAAALATVERWNEVTGALFGVAGYSRVADPRARLLAYLDFRAQIGRGGLADVSCLLGTLAQETFKGYPALRAACGAGIKGHAEMLTETIREARARHAPGADWTAESLAEHMQAVLQGAFVVAKALDDPDAIDRAIVHLRRYIEQLLPADRTAETRPADGAAHGSDPSQTESR